MMAGRRRHMPKSRKHNIQDGRIRRLRPATRLVRGDVQTWDAHLPVLAAFRTPLGTVETPKALAYGTAFPIAPGILLTAGHVVKDAAADGVPALTVVRPGEQAIVHEIVDYELVDAIDLAILRSPSLEKLPALEIDFDRPLEMLMPAQAIGFAGQVRCCGRGSA